MSVKKAIDKQGIVTVIRAIRERPKAKDKGRVLHWTVSVLGGRKINRRFKTQAEARDFARMLESENV